MIPAHPPPPPPPQNKSGVRRLRLFPFIFSKNFYAYNYLSNSTKVFPHGKSFNNILKKNGFIDVEDSPQTFGVASIYFAKKR